MGNNYQFNPLRDWAAFQERLNTIIDEAAQQPRGGRYKTEADTFEMPQWTPQTDVYEQDENIVLVLDVPGVKSDSIDIQLDDDRVTSSGGSAVEAEDDRLRERPAGRLVRVFRIQSEVERENIKANYKDGVLRVRLPKRRDDTARKVTINVA